MGVGVVKPSESIASWTGLVKFSEEKVVVVIQGIVRAVLPFVFQELFMGIHQYFFIVAYRCQGCFVFIAMVYLNDAFRVSLESLYC